MTYRIYIVNVGEDLWDDIWYRCRISTYDTNHISFNLVKPILTVSHLDSHISIRCHTSLRTISCIVASKAQGRRVSSGTPKGCRRLTRSLLGWFLLHTTSVKQSWSEETPIEEIECGIHGFREIDIPTQLVHYEKAFPVRKTDRKRLCPAIADKGSWWKTIRTLSKVSHLDRLPVLPYHIIRSRPPVEVARLAPMFLVARQHPMNCELSAQNRERSTNENHSLMNVCDDEKKRILLNYCSESSWSYSYIIVSVTCSSLVDLGDM